MVIVLDVLEYYFFCFPFVYFECICLKSMVHNNILCIIIIVYYLKFVKKVPTFHLRNNKANRSLKVVVWNETELENTTHSKYFSVTLDRSFNYDQHMHNTKIKVTTRNNILSK